MTGTVANPGLGCLDDAVKDKELVTNDMGFSDLEFRSALGAFPTGVCVLTCPGTGASGPVGMTVNSFTSVSLDPPLVLWCIGKTSDRFEPFMAADCYGVNMLASDQQALSVAFAESGAVKGRVGFKTWETGAPIFEKVAAALDCTVEARHDAGDHIILVGKVVKLASDPKRAPLVYYRGSYCALDCGS